MRIDFHDLKNHDFSLSEIKIIKQLPKYRMLDCGARQVGGVLYILNGECRYTFDGGSFTLEKGSVVYLPLGSKHRLDILSEKIEFYRVDFVLKIGETYVRFSDGPLKLSDASPYECLEALRELEAIFLRDNDSILKTEKLCRFISLLDKARYSAVRTKLSPAIERLHQSDDTERISCAELAGLCYLGVSQFYSLFHKEFGTSPLEYRANIIIRKATTLLEAGEMTVGEVAESLGFENASYFCRFFKKRVGSSPAAFIKQIRK